MIKTEWGVTLGVKRIPSPQFVTANVSDRETVYGWKIDRHGIVAYGNTCEQCKTEWANAYLSETGQAVA